MKKLFCLFLPIVFIGATCTNVKPDSSIQSAIQAGDESAILKGCGLGHQNGLIHCRVADGSDMTQTVTVTVPLVDCKFDSCATITGFQKNGNSVALGSIPKGQTELEFPLSKLVGGKTADKKHGGPYRVLIELEYINKKAGWKQAQSGVVYVSILEKGYHVLNCDSSNAVWKLAVSETCEIQFSTKMRTALCGEC